MKPTALSHNRSRQRKAPSIALFPFLAVLICTMGALVPLLLGIARQARLQARAAAQEKAARQHLDFQAEREAAEWRVEQLKASRAATEEQVKAARYKLGHLEDHARRLRQQAADLEAAWQDLENADSQANRQRGDLETEYRHLQVELSKAQRDLADTQQAAANRQPSYAVVPYEGPNHTRRRPIYLECVYDGVILQPEGVKLTPNDFLGPMGPGNPLAALLRAVREYWLTNGGFDPQKEGEPYPLLLVRPRGTLFYYAARDAMSAWGREFGYELIEEDWKLDFPPSDARLMMTLDRTLSVARMEQKRLIAAAPRKYSKQKPIYHVPAGSGGAQRESGGEDRSALYNPARPAGGVGRRYDGSAEARGYGPPGDGAGPGNSGVPGGGGVAARPGNGRGNGLPNAPTEAQNLAAVYGGLNTGGAGGGSPGGVGGVPGVAGPGGAGAGVGGPGGFGAGGGPGVPGTGSGVPGGSGSGPGGYASSGPGANGAGGYAGGGYAGGGGGTGSSAGNSSGGGTPGAVPGGGMAGNAVAASGGMAGSGAPGAVPGNSIVGNGMTGSSMAGTAAGNSMASGGSPGQSCGVKAPEGYVGGRPRDQDIAANTPKPPLAGQQVGMPLRPGEWYEPPPRIDRPPEPTNEKDREKEKKRLEKVAKNRGYDWGLRNPAAGATPVSRTIRIDCYHDQLVLAPEHSARLIQFKGPTDSAVDALIAAVWAEMESWGIAGKGMYWRPILRFQVAPGGEQRFQDLQTLLEMSGLAVEKR